MTDVNHRGVLVGRYNCALDDMSLDVTMGVNLCLRKNGRLDDLNLDVNLCPRMSDLLVDRNLVVMTDVNLCLRTNDLLVDRNLDGMTGGNRGHRMSDLLVDHSMDDDHRDVLVDHHTNVTGDLNLDASHANRNCVRRDRSLGVMMDGNLCHRMNDLLVDRNLVVMTDGMNHHVM